MYNFDEECMKHKKKKNNSSKSSKRSDHKHEYETVLVQGFLFGFSWADRCNICGRLKERNYFAAVEGLRKPKKGKYISSEDYFSASELHEKFPDTKIFIYKDSPQKYPLDHSLLVPLEFDEDQNTNQ